MSAIVRILCIGWIPMLSSAAIADPVVISPLASIVLSNKSESAKQAEIERLSKRSNSVVAISTPAVLGPTLVQQLQHQLSYTLNEATEYPGGSYYPQLAVRIQKQLNVALAAESSGHPLPALQGDLGGGGGDNGAGSSCCGFEPSGGGQTNGNGSQAAASESNTKAQGRASLQGRPDGVSKVSSNEVRDAN